MRLTSLTISNFRGFAREQTLDLDGDVVIVFGPNGTGKTTILDALQWLVMGDVPRLRRAALKPQEDVVSSRYATGQPSVRARLRDGEGDEIEIARHGLGKAMRLSVTSSGAEPLTDESAAVALARLFGRDDPREAQARFGRTHLLQQDELTELLHADTKERYQFLANLTGLEELQRLDVQLRAELKSLRAGLKERRHELDRLRGSVIASERTRSEAEDVVVQEETVAEDRMREALARVVALLGQPSADEPERLLDEALDRMALIRDRVGRLVESRLRAEEADEGLVEEARAAEHQVAVCGDHVRVREANVAAAAEALAELEREQDRVQRLAELALEQMDDRHCPVCGQSHDPKATRERLRRILGEDQRLLVARNALESRHADLVQAREAEGRAQTAALNLRRLVDSADEANRVKAVYRSELQTIIPGGSNAAKVTDEALTAHAMRAVEELDAAVSALRSALRDRTIQADLHARVQAAARDAEARRRRLDRLEEDVLDLEQRAQAADGVYRWLGEQVVETTTRIVDASTPIVNALYTRLDVHPSFRRFAFRSDRRYEAGHLRPWVYDDEQQADGNAVHVLSAAQLNALALCLFFSLNLEEAGPFSTALLDDPVQSMDDINILSLADVLRTLRRRRQLVLTTHDPNLARLLARKLRPLADGERTLFLSLAAWSPEGPRVTVESQNPDPYRTALELVSF